MYHIAIVDNFDTEAGLWHESVPMTNDAIDALYGNPVVEVRTIDVGIETELALSAIAHHRYPMTVLQAVVQLGTCDMPDLLMHTSADLDEVRAQLSAFEVAGVIVSDVAPDGFDMFKIAIPA